MRTGVESLNKVAPNTVCLSYKHSSGYVGCCGKFTLYTNLHSGVGNERKGERFLVDFLLR